jgi:hypothetical protein
MRSGSHRWPPTGVELHAALTVSVVSLAGIIDERLGAVLSGVRALLRDLGASTSLDGEHVDGARRGSSAAQRIG